MTTKPGGGPGLVAAAWAIGTIVIAGTAFRFLSFDRFQNDQFVHLSRAYQMTLGERPFRDFDDPGLPLQVAVSAAGLALQPDSLLPELAIGALALGVAAAATWLAVALLTASPWAAWLAAALQIAAYPRLYSYPKLLVHALVALGLVVYARQPSRGRLVMLAALTVIGGLFRFDHGIYAAVACLVVLILVHRRESTRPILTFAAVALAMATPFLLYLQLNGGIVDVTRTALRFSEAEAIRTVNVTAWTWLGAPVIPLLVFLVIRLQRRAAAGAAAAALGIATLAGLLCATLLRDSVMVRLPDVYAPASSVCAWLLVELWRTTSPGLRVPARTAAVVLAGAAFAATVRVGDTVHEVFETRIFEGPAAMVTHATTLSRSLTEWPWASVIPDERLEVLVRRLNTCTSPGDRIAVVGFAPEITFLARRPFAGRQPALLPGYVNAAADRTRVSESFQRHPPAVVLVEEQEADSLADDLPPVSALLREYNLAGAAAAGPLTFGIWVRPGLAC